MGTEKNLSSALARALLHDVWGPASPGEPKGTPNHRLLYHAMRTLWHWRFFDSLFEREARLAIEFLDFEDFMARPNVTEQLSPSHSQWWFNGVFALRFWASRVGLKGIAVEVHAATTRWIRHHQALCRRFATPAGIVAPGARAWPEKPGKAYNGRCWERDQLYRLIETGDWPSRVREPKESNLGELGLVFALKLAREDDDFGGARDARELPKLRFPILRIETPGGFVAWQTKTKGLQAQRFASYINGVERYGFDDVRPRVAGISEIIGKTASNPVKDKTVANLRGTIGPDGYRPPANVSVTWRRPGQPDITKKLRHSIPFTGSGNASVYSRYGEDDPECKGRQITAIGAEQLGGRAWLILKELYAQAGINRVPPQIGQEVWDFAVAEVGSKPADWCDYKRFTGKPDPICGENCPPCSGGGAGEPIAPGQTVPAPTNLRFKGTELHFDWEGPKGVVHFTLYRGAEGHLTLLKTGRSSPLTLSEVPPAGTSLMLYATMRKRAAAAAQMVVGAEETPVEPPPVEPPPPVDPVEPPPPPAVEVRGRIEVMVDGEVVATYSLVKA